VSRGGRDRVDELERGREAYATRAWLQAYEALIAAEERAALEPSDVELLATCVFMLGRDDESAAWLERGHQRYL
jgi:MoxR-like ATPase